MEMNAMRTGKPDRFGFTFIEILIVVALFMMLAAVGVTQLLRARITTNEQLAITSLRTIGKACQFYYLANAGTYPPTLVALGPGPGGANPPYLDATLAQDPATKQGYIFTYVRAGGGASSTLTANPQQPGTSGTRHFYIDQQFVIHATEQNRDANASDPVIP